MKTESDDDIFALDLVAELTPKQRELLGRMREIAKTFSGGPSSHTKNLILCWLAKRTPADLADRYLVGKIKEAFHTTGIFTGTRSRPIFPFAIFARRAALRR